MDESEFNAKLAIIKEYENSVNLNEQERFNTAVCTWANFKNRTDLWNDFENLVNKKLEYLNFGHDVDEVTSGNYHPINAVKVLNSTPSLLQGMGFKNYPILYSQRHIIDALKPKENDYPSYHGFSIEEIKRLPELLDKKIAICSDNPSRSDSMLLVLEAVDGEKLPLISSIKPDGKGNYEFEEIKTNYILTVFGKDNFEQYFDKVVGLDNIIYFDYEKVKNLEALAERQLFSCHPKTMNTILRYPECIVKNKDIESIARLQLAHSILENVAKENNWKYFSIVEDSYSFNNGLMMIGYSSYEAQQGMCDGELGHECLNLSALANDKVIFEGLDEIVDVDVYVKEHGISQDNFADVKEQDFIDTQGLNEQVYASQHADASFAKPLKFSDIKTSADVKNWAQAVNEKMKSFVCNKDNPSSKMKNFVKQERNLFGEVDKYRDYPVVRWNDANVLADDARKVMREEFADVEHLECAMKVWMNYNNNPNMEINDLYLQQIQNNNVNGVLGYYLSQLPPQNEGEKVFYDNEVLQNLIDEEFIDEINQNATSRQFEILSDGEEIPFDVQQGQNDKSQEAKNKNKNLNKQKAQFRKNNYKRTDQWEESRTDRQKIKTPTELMEYATKKAAEINSQNQKSQHQEREKKQSRSNNGFSR